MNPEAWSCLIASAVALSGYLCLRWCVRHRPTPEGVSQAWRLEQQRREMAAGVELPCISWSAMRQLARERGVI